MARESTTSYGSNLTALQVKISTEILKQNPVIEGDLHDALYRILTKRKSSMSFTKAALNLDYLAGVPVSHMVETYEDEMTARKDT